MGDFYLTLLFYPFVVGWLWQLGGADWPDSVRWGEGKWWRRIGTAILLLTYVRAAGHPWYVSLGCGLATFVSASLGYGRSIERRRWLLVWLIGSMFGVPILVLALTTHRFILTPLALLPSLVWLVVVRWSNRKVGWRLPWKVAEGLTGLSIGVSQAVLLWL